MPNLLDGVGNLLTTQYRMEGREVDATLLGAVMLTVDEAAERAAAAARVWWEPWDWTSPINGVPAETVKERSDVVPGEAYLVYVDGLAAVFQPHLPGEPGLVAIEDETAMRAAAEQQVADLVDGLAAQQIIETVRQRLDDLSVSVVRTAFMQQERGLVQQRSEAIQRALEG